MKFKVKGSSWAQRSAMQFLWEPCPQGEGWWSANLFATRASILQGGCLLFVGARPRSDGWWSARVIATRASLLQGRLVCFLWEPRLGVMGGGLRGFSRRGRRSYRGVSAFCGSPASGRWAVVCEGDRDEGVDPTGAACLLFVGAPPRGDGWWSARVIATRASLLQGRIVCLL